MGLQLHQLQVAYGQGANARVAVAGVSLALARGEIGVLIGPSGCGKSSLLRAIAGLEPAQAGSIRCGGQILSAPGHNVPPEQRRVGMVFQDYALFPHMSVERNIAFGLAQLPRAAQAERVAQMLQVVGLQGMQTRMPHQLSGGQQQRVALARALARAPDVLLLDEPFSSLDAELRERLAAELRGILKATGTTALLVTHDQNEAFAIADSVGVMQAGRLHQWADPHTLYHEPATRFVAEFVGHSVLLPAQVAQAADGLAVLHTPLGTLPLPAEQAPAVATGTARELLLRADDVLHDDAAPTQARIVSKLFRGSEFLYTLALPSGHEVLAYVPSHHEHHVGESIGIRLALDHVVTFPLASAAQA